MGFFKKAGSFIRNPFIHMQVLTESSPDIFGLAEAVEQRCRYMCDTYIARHHVPIALPPELNQDMLLCQRMRLRHVSGDLRNTRDEELATRRIAEWAYLENCKLHNQKPKKLLWAD